MGGAIWLIMIGLFVWFLNLGYFSFWKWSRDWPLILVAVGIYLLLSNFGGKLKRIFALKRTKSRKEKIKEVLEKIDRGKISAREAIEEIERLE